VRGFVTDAETSTPLPNANVVLRQMGTEAVRGVVTRPNGFYQIGDLVPGRYVFRVSFVGYAEHADTLDLDAGTVRTINVALAPTEAQLEEIVVESEEGAAQLRGGQQRIEPADIARIPTPDVSGDLASYLQSLPSVVSSGDRGGQLFIRGGTPSQNLVRIDGVPVYLPFHIVGFYSAFPQDLVANAEVHAGGFGAEYSSRISSVIDVTMREGNKQRFEGAASISPFLVGAQVEGPIKTGQTSLLASSRHSIIERMAPLYDQSMPFRFGDTLLRLHSTPSDNFRYSMTGLHTYDRGRVDAGDTGRDNVFRWSNVVLGTHLLALPSASAQVFELTGGFTYATNEVGSPERPERLARILRLSVAVDIQEPEGRMRRNWGLFTRLHWMDRQLAEQFSGVESRSEVLLGAGGYFELATDLTETLTVTPGVVTSWYDGAVPIVEPRLRASWAPVENHTFTAASGLYAQPVIGATDERDAGSVFTAWLPDAEGETLRALHVLGGWQGRVGPFEMALEGYYKHLSNLKVPVFSPRASFTTELTPATGTIYGVDTRLEWSPDPFYAYLGYGWTWTRYHASEGSFTVGFEEPVREYHPPHDRRHQVNAVVSVDEGPWSASLRWTFGSGLPFTQFEGFDDFLPPRGRPPLRDRLGESRLFLREPYRARLPVYHRLDASLQRVIDFEASEMTVQIGGINVYDRRNLFYLDLFTAQRVDQLPVVPYLSLKFSTN
jgi:hypothetical protein